MSCHSLRIGITREKEHTLCDYAERENMTDSLLTNTLAVRRITLEKAATFKVGEACNTVEPVKR